LGGKKEEPEGEWLDFFGMRYRWIQEAVSGQIRAEKTL